MTDQPFLTVAEVARRLSYSPKTVRIMCANGRLPATRWARGWRIDAVQFEQGDGLTGGKVYDNAGMAAGDGDELLTGPRLRGLTPSSIHALHPELGVPRTIQNIRRLNSQDALGYPLRRGKD